MKNKIEFVFLPVCLMLACSFCSTRVGIEVAAKSAVIDADPAQKDQTSGAWHAVETWSFSITTGDPSRADQRKHLTEPSQQDDGDGHSRPAIADQRTRRRKVKKVHRLRKLLGLTFATALWKDFLLPFQCVIISPYFS